MEFFQPIEGHTLLRSNGAFSEHQLYVDDQNLLYARKGNSYLRLLDNAATSRANTFWDDLRIPDTNKGYDVGPFGRLVLVQSKRPKARSKH